MLDRYIATRVVMFTMAIAVLLCCVVWMTQSLRLVDLIVNRGLPLSTFFYLCSLLIPRLLMVVVPIAVFLAVLLVYNRLIAENQMVVMQTAGVGNLRLALPGLAVAVAGSLVVLLIGARILPAAYSEFRDLRYRANHHLAGVLLREGEFGTLTKGITVYVRTRDAEGQFRGIMLHDSRNPDRPVTMMAQRGVLVPGEDGAQVLLVGGHRQEVDRGSGRLSMLYFDSYNFRVPQDEASPLRLRDPRELTLEQLFWEASFKPGTRRAGQLLAEAHFRFVLVAMPLSCAAVAMAFLLCGSYRRQGTAPDIFKAAGTVLAIFVAGLALKNLAVDHPVAVPGLYMIYLLPLAFAVAALGGAPVFLRPGYVLRRSGLAGGFPGLIPHRPSPVFRWLAPVSRLLGPVLHRLGAAFRRLDPVFRRLGAVSRRFGPVLHRLGAAFRRLDPVFRRLGAVSRLLGPVLHRLGAAFRRLDPVFRRLGAVSRRFGPALHRLGAAFRLFGPVPRLLGSVLRRAGLGRRPPAPSP